MDVRPEAQGFLPPAAQDWLQSLCDLTDEEGFLEPVGTQHHAFHLPAGPQLLVCFERLSRLTGQAPGRWPAAWQLAREEGWSLLVLISETDGWFRAPALWHWLDDRSDEGFFDAFPGALFFGSGPAGHAACVYSAAAPGARVLALAPVATLDPDIAGWDQRWPEMRRADFRSRYGYGPDLIHAASSVTLLHDPEVPEDDMHSALYRRGFVQSLRARGAGRDPQTILEEAGILPQLLREAAGPGLSPQSFAQLWRARRRSPAWLRGRAALTTGTGHPARAALVLRHALQLSPGDPRLLRHAATLGPGAGREALPEAQDGFTLERPPQLR